MSRLSALRLSRFSPDPRAKVSELLADAREALDALDCELEEVIKGEGVEARIQRWIDRQVMTGASAAEVAFVQRLLGDLF